MAHYFDESPRVPSAGVELAVQIEGTSLRLRTDRGVFSHGRLDPGTALLLRSAPPPAGSSLLDLGCGSGALAIALAHRCPSATVWAVDVNARARQLTATNASLNGMANVVVTDPADVPPGVAFDTIWSNPPIRIGKPALHELLTAWLARLSPDGRGVLVVQRHLGADSLQRWLAEQGWPTRRIASSRGYRLLDVAARR